MKRSVAVRVGSAILSYGVVGVVVWLVYRSVHDSQGVSDAFSSISWVEVLVVCVLGLLYLVSMLRPMIYTLPGLSMGQAAVSRTASLALTNTVPEGGTVATGLTFAMYRSWGFGVADSTTSIIAIAIWTNLSRYALMALALVVLVTFGSVASSVVWTAVGTCVVVAAVCLLIALMIINDRFARAVGRILTRLRGALSKRISRLEPKDLVAVVSEFRLHLLSRVRTCWRSLTATVVLSQLVGALVLGVAVRMVGLGEDEIGWARIMVAFGAMGLAIVLAPTPGGLGVAEAALLGVLGVGLASSAQAELVAAVLLFRMATWLLPIPIGLVAYLYWRTTKNWRISTDRVHALQTPPAGTDTSSS